MKKIVQTSWIDPETNICYFATGDLIRGAMGIRSGFDRFAEPDEPDEIDNIEIYVDGELVKVSDEIFKQIENALYEDDSYPTDDFELEY